MHPYGRCHKATRLYRGHGYDHIVGLPADESSLYLQNETGVWGVAVNPTDPAGPS